MRRIWLRFWGFLVTLSPNSVKIFPELFPHPQLPIMKNAGLCSPLKHKHLLLASQFQWGHYVWEWELFWSEIIQVVYGRVSSPGFLVSITQSYYMSSSITHRTMIEYLPSVDTLLWPGEVKIGIKCSLLETPTRHCKSWSSYNQTVHAPEHKSHEGRGLFSLVFWWIPRAWYSTWYMGGDA
jgi:hypothetical protein